MMAVKVYGSVAQAKREGLRPKLTPVLHTFAFDGTLYFFLYVRTLSSSELPPDIEDSLFCECKGISL